MMIDSEKCQELGLPIPKRSETQYFYVLRCILSGHRLNTRVCRYIGIHNLHSLASTLKKKRVPFCLNHEKAYCPKLNETPSNPVDSIYMNQEQVRQYKGMKKPA